MPLATKKTELTDRDLEAVQGGAITSGTQIIDVIIGPYPLPCPEPDPRTRWDYSAPVDYLY